MEKIAVAPMITSQNFVNKTYYVFGLSRTGKGAVKCLHSSGAKVYAWDDNAENIKSVDSTQVEFIIPSEMNWSKVDALVLSPGVPIIGDNANQVVKFAKENNIEIISDLDLLYQACPDAKYIGITGTNGKSTTTALVGHILKNCGYKVYVGGNIGNSVLELEQLGSEGLYVIEASSFQLDISSHIRFNIAAVINITPDHLDRHLTMENYIAAKGRILRNQTGDDIAIISKDYNIPFKGKNLVSISCKTEADIACKDRIITDGNKTFDLTDMKFLPGKHNEENIVAAYAICTRFGAKPEDVIKHLKTFAGLEHRIEFVLEKNGLQFINDSKATNADAAEKALRCFDNIYWILGGVDKTDGIDSLNPLFKKVKKAYLIGKAQDRFAGTLATANCNFEKVETIEGALDKIKAENPSSGVVLLSPACASYDQFKDFEHRGRVFKDLVKARWA
jgi:UDP-N-acetylmuramoylalanine--D-glutamate ligase